MQRSRRLVAETRDQMRGLFDDATEGLKANRDKILNEKRDLEKKVGGESEAQRMMRLADNFLASQSTGTGHASPDLTADGKVVIRRGVSTADYQRLKKLAAVYEGGSRLRRRQRRSILRQSAAKRCAYGPRF